jgi:hypothetical protein
MIIANDNAQQRYPGRGPWWQWQNIPPGHQNHRHHQGNYWTQPIISVQQPTRAYENQLPFTTPQAPGINNNNDGSNNNNNNDNSNSKPHTTPNYHGGEGLIDIRLGE